MTGVRGQLRAEFGCAREDGGCGAAPGAWCQSRSGALTQPHGARWSAHWRKYGSAPGQPPAPGYPRPRLAEITDARLCELPDAAPRLLPAAADPALSDQEWCEARASAWWLTGARA